MDHFVAGAWRSRDDAGTAVLDPSTGEEVARVSTEPVPAERAFTFARARGADLRALTFQQRAAVLKKAGTHLQEHKQALYDLSFATGATSRDAAVDVDGGIGTLLSFASRGRRELPDSNVWLDGPVEQLGKGFLGQHVLTPRHGVVLQVNAFNFPVWGMLEKLAPAFLAGVPSIVKPAPQTAFVTQECVRLLADVLPEGSLQLLVGGTDGLLDHLTGQDSLAFTGSAATAALVRAHPTVVRNAVRFTAEADSLNGCVLGPDGDVDLFVREVVREMTAKTGQKCTAIRRAFVPRSVLADVHDAIVAKLDGIVVGDPRTEGTRMGPVVSVEQAARVRDGITRLGGAATGEGAFVPPTLVTHRDPELDAVHEVEAFGPVCSLLPYDGSTHAVNLLARGRGSLVTTVVSEDPAFVTAVVLGTAPFHGRVHVLDRSVADTSTGHGSPMPVLTHGGPGRAGSGEELGGLRAVAHHLQRTAVQGSPAVLQAITGSFVRSGPRQTGVHPFRKSLHELEVGDSVETASRLVTLEDVSHFAEFTGDTFYAHTDEAAAAANPLFGGIVAHGYLVLSLAAGLFVDPAPGPVLANTGLDRLRFTKPVKPGDTIRAILTCQSKVSRTPEQGEVRWDVQVLDQDDVTVASYELLTMVRA
jgi:oxepin-CoA hydrolase/3-oxo-5,6-dehydrosuberyl-CoA semialdehyde dehydrogenase